MTLIIQIVVFIIVGLSTVLLVFDDLIRHKNPASIFISLWVLGTFSFAFFLNWTVNVRTILPVAPVLGIIIMRRIESKYGRPDLTYSRLLIPLLMSTILALSVMWADYSLANLSREAAREITYKYVSDKRNVWFQGHWGFQYYMEKFGGKSMDFGQLERIRERDIMVIPSRSQNTNTKPIINPTETIQFSSHSWISIMNLEDGAGFYSSLWGPAPFVFGPAYPEIYDIVQI